VLHAPRSRLPAAANLARGQSPRCIPLSEQPRAAEIITAGATFAAMFGTLARRRAAADVAVTQEKPEAGEQAKPKRRSGSQKRKLKNHIAVHCDDEQFEAISEKAYAAGVSRSAFALAAMLNAPPPRQRPTFGLSREALAGISSATTALNRAHSNANQIARELNQQKFLPDGGLFIRARNGDSGAILTIEAMLLLLEKTCEEMRAAAREMRRAAGYDRQG
jgi:hypothetical protein